MRGKTVVITEGTSGIGEVAVRKLAEMGARIILVAPQGDRGHCKLSASGLCRYPVWRPERRNHLEFHSSGQVFRDIS